MAMNNGQGVRIANVKLKGESVAGTFPLVREEGDIVVVRHPTHGNIKIPRRFTNIPGAAPVTLSYDELISEIRSRFDVLSGLIDGVIIGRIRSVIVSGAPGVGKTYTIETKLREAKKAGKVKKVTQIRGTVSPIGLYMLLWENRQVGQVIVLDDSDSIFNNEDGVNILKAATDSGKTRIVSYVKEANALEANGIPKSFEYTGSIVVATNLDFEREIASRSKNSVHLGAFLNRAYYLDLGLHSQQALMARVQDVCFNTPMLRDEGLTEAQIKDVVTWLKDNQATARSLSLRTAMRVADLIAAQPNDWRKTAKATLLKAQTR